MDSLYNRQALLLLTSIYNLLSKKVHTVNTVHLVLQKMLKLQILL